MKRRRGGDLTVRMRSASQSGLVGNDCVQVIVGIRAGFSTSAASLSVSERLGGRMGGCVKDG